MSNPPGLIQPTIPSYPAGSGNTPASAAIAINNTNNQKLQNINQMAAGSKRRRYKGGDNSQVSVPVIKPIYPQQNGNGADTTSQQANLSKHSMQSSSWSTNDSQATKMGGSKKGGNPNWSWPCSSGGKRSSGSKRRRTNRRKSRKNQKRTRRHRR